MAGPGLGQDCLFCLWLNRARAEVLTFLLNQDRAEIATLKADSVPGLKFPASANL